VCSSGISNKVSDLYLCMFSGHTLSVFGRYVDVLLYYPS